MIGPSVTVRTNIVEVRRQLPRYRRQVTVAAYRALNRTATQVRTQARRALARQMGLPQKQIKHLIDVRKAGRFRLEADVNVPVRPPLNVTRFQARKTNRGISAKPWGNRRVFAGTFFLRGGKQGGGGVEPVMVRKGRSRFPIRPVWGPSISREFVRDEVDAAMRRATTERFPVLFERQLRYELGKVGVRVTA